MEDLLSGISWGSVQKQLRSRLNLDINNEKLSDNAEIQTPAVLTSEP